MSYYVWANEDCCNKTDSIKEAFKWRYEFMRDGAENVYVTDGDNAIVTNNVSCDDLLIEAKGLLSESGTKNPEYDRAIYELCFRALGLDDIEEARKLLEQIK